MILVVLSNKRIVSILSEADIFKWFECKR